MLRVTGSTLEQWREAQRLRTQTSPQLTQHYSNSVQWEKPWQEWVKLNVDAAIFNETSSIGIGCVLWNSSGELIIAKAMPMYQKVGSKEAETTGVREALSWIKQMGLMKVLVEMDSQVVFNALKISSLSASPFNLLIKDC